MEFRVEVVGGDFIDTARAHGKDNDAVDLLHCGPQLPTEKSTLSAGRLKPRCIDIQPMFKPLLSLVNCRVESMMCAERNVAEKRRIL